MFVFPKTTSRLIAAEACILGALAIFPPAATAQNADNPPEARRTASAKPAPHDSKVLNGIERGSAAAGQGVAHADQATRRGVNNTAERASAPVRRWGESLGRKLGTGSSGKSGSPTVGPQGNAP